MKGVRVMGWGLAFGTVGFVAGFIGPTALNPGASEDPILGIFLTGPLGLMIGIVFGLARERAARLTARQEKA